MTEPDSTSDKLGLGDPPASVWTELGLVLEAEVHGGFQSKVYLATGKAGRLIVKLTEATPADAVLRDRVEMTRQLAEVNPAVVGPLVLGSESVVSVDRWNAVCYPYVEGARPDTNDGPDVETMAATLAKLHDSLATLTNDSLPPVAALNVMPEGSLGQSKSRGQGQSKTRVRGQLIHGDYAAANLIVTTSGLRVIDFDECGQGSVEFEIGNTLYMTLFDAWHSGTIDRYDRFRSWFVESYQRAASIDVEDALLDEAIQIRVGALEQWLARPAEAPVGIRTSSPEWKQQLRRFVTEVPR